jgi:nicotinamide mononucleotide (NMN) deamidase PncC
MCAATEDAVLSQGFKFEGGRNEIREQAVKAAVTMLLKVI